MPLVKQGQMTRDPLHRSAKVGDPLWNWIRWLRDTKLLSIEASQLCTHRRQEAEGRRAGGQEGGSCCRGRGRGCGCDRGRRNNHDALGKLMSTDSGQLRRG